MSSAASAGISYVLWSVLQCENILAAMGSEKDRLGLKKSEKTSQRKWHLSWDQKKGSRLFSQEKKERGQRKRSAHKGLEEERGWYIQGTTGGLHWLGQCRLGGARWERNLEKRLGQPTPHQPGKEDWPWSRGNEEPQKALSREVRQPDLYLRERWLWLKRIRKQD